MISGDLIKEVDVAFDSWMATKGTRLARRATPWEDPDVMSMMTFHRDRNIRRKRILKHCPALRGPKLLIA